MELIANILLWVLLIYVLVRPNVWSAYLLLFLTSLATLVFNGFVAMVVMWVISLFFSILVIACIQLYRKYK